ncbi:hypothetical protein DY000_02037163 [Brassica cretica]|uniref:Uncharacterized protein n=1 Tax=Brassica cretica TaxID=69181 RepID=A0ABQ7BF24_BRACR|nr:hypothetical protein DY000_02037163 [Brassica cretica]
MELGSNDGDSSVIGTDFRGTRKRKPRGEVNDDVDWTQPRGEDEEPSCWCWSTTWSSWRHLGAFGAQKKCLKRSMDEQCTRATSPERRREVDVTHIPERPGQSDMERSLAFLS